MCLAMPAQVLDWLDESDSARLVWVDFGGVRRSVSLLLTPEAGPGSWIIVHAGFALAVLDEDAAAAALAAHRDLEQVRL